MVDLETLEDLAMELVEKQNSDLYTRKILPLYKEVKEIVVGEIPLLKELTIGYGTDFSEVGGGDFLTLDAMARAIGENHNITIPDGDVEDMLKIFDVVLYVLGREDAKGYNKKAKELVEENFMRVSKIYKEIEQIIIGCDGDKFGVLSPVPIIPELKQDNFKKALDSQLVNNMTETEKLMEKAPYHIVEYLAKRPAQ